jgi:PAS domain S-box-containing protein
MTSALRWGGLGAAFGACFPILALCIQHGVSGAGDAGTVLVHDLLFWLIATAPLFLGLFGVLAGRLQDRMKAILAQQESLVQARTQELRVALMNVEMEAGSAGELLEALNRQVSVFEQAVDSLDSAFAMFDADERLIVCNQAYADLNLLPKEFLSKRPRYEDLLRQILSDHPEQRENILGKSTPEQWLEERLAEFRNPKAPSVLWNGNHWIRLDDKKTPDGGTVCLRTDVTNLKEAEFEARIQQQRLTLAATSAGIGIWETDLAASRVVWDERMEVIHGYAPGTFPGTIEAWKSRIHPEDLPLVELSIEQSVAQGGADFHGTYRIVLPDGKVRHIDRRGSHTKDLQGKLVRRIGINMDITEHVETAEVLRAAVLDAQAATQAKAEFLATMSHEIRTPMNGVIGMTELLLDTDLTPLQREHAETIRSSGEALLAIINDILDFSKMEAGKLILEALPFSVEQVVRDSVSLFTSQAATKGVQMLQSLPNAPTDVVGDPGRLRQVLLNLISNALKFTSEGRVEVRLSVVTTAHARVDITIEVSDTGIGMAPEYLARLGEAFSQADASTTRQFGGTGLGLSICRNLVRLMQGSMTVHSTVGEGTSFRVTLPMPVAGVSSSTRLALASLQPTQRLKRVLVAEDNIVNQRVIMSLLKKFADHVELAVDGQEAFEKFQLERYDCVLMDGQMPRVDGLEATRLIRAYEVEQHRVRTPIIALTASAMSTDRDLFLASGMDEYVTKPVRSRELMAALTRIYHPRTAKSRD